MNKSRQSEAVAPGSVLSLSRFAVAAAGRTLLAGIDLQLSGGELLAIIGPSGCGKTSLLRAVAGLTDPVEGEARLAGQCPADLRWPCYRRRNVLVDQRPVLRSGTVRANLERPFRYRTATGPYPAAAAQELLEQLGLGPDRLNQDARSLSQGEQQRVCLARALLLEPAVLLLDEPTSALDEEAAAATEQVVRREARHRGLAGLIVTHSRRQAERWCDRSFDLKPYMARQAKAGGG
jgi:putative ABC transport system ATP-binding protein